MVQQWRQLAIMNFGDGQRTARCAAGVSAVGRTVDPGFANMPWSLMRQG